MAGRWQDLKHPVDRKTLNLQEGLGPTFQLGCPVDRKTENCKEVKQELNEARQSGRNIVYADDGIKRHINKTSPSLPCAALMAIVWTCLITFMCCKIHFSAAPCGHHTLYFCSESCPLFHPKRGPGSTMVAVIRFIRLPGSS